MKYKFLLFKGLSTQVQKKEITIIQVQLMVNIIKQH